MAYLIKNEMIPHCLENEIALIDGVISKIVIDNDTHLEIVTYPTQEGFENGAILGLVKRPFVEFVISCGGAGDMTPEMIAAKYGNQIPSELISNLVENFSREYDNLIIIPEGISIAIPASPYISIYELMVNNGAKASGAVVLNDPVNNTAYGAYSLAEGLNTISNGIAQHVQGKYNIIDNDNKYAHIVGNGTDNNNRSNAHAVDWNGNTYYAGDVYANAKFSEDGTVVGEKLTTEEYVNERSVQFIDNAYVVYNGDIIHDYTCHVVEKFPTDPTPTTLDSATIYFIRETGRAFIYLDEQIAESMGISDRWITLDDAAPLFGLTYGGIINSSSQCVENTIHLLLIRNLYASNGEISLTNIVNGSGNSSLVCKNNVNDNDASGDYSFAGGKLSSTEGDFSLAYGEEAKAYSYGSGSIGIGTIATNPYQFVSGRFNRDLPGNGWLRTVGNGSPETRSNAYMLHESGNAYYSGNVYVNATIGDNSISAHTLATEDYVDGRIHEYVQSDDLLNFVDITKFNTPTYDMGQICYGNGVYSITSRYGGPLYYSYNGIDILRGETIISPISICYGNGMFIIVSSGGAVYYSTDGIHYTIVYDIEFETMAIDWRSVSYCNDMFMAHGRIDPDTTIIASSNDGLSWNIVNLNESVNCDSTDVYTNICYGNGLFIGLDSSFAYYSTDGIEWYVEPIKGFSGTDSAAVSKILYVSGKFVAIGTNYLTNKVWYSNNGFDWFFTNLQYSEDSSDFHLNDICYSNGKFMICGGIDHSSATALTPSMPFIAYSKNGIDWNIELVEHDIGGINYFMKSICYGEDKFVSISETGKLTLNITATSKSIKSTIIEDHNNLINITNNLHYYNDKDILIDSSKFKISSEYLRDISFITSGEIGEGSWESICYGKDKFVAISTGKIAYSMDNGITWNIVNLEGDGTDMRAICYNDGIYVVTTFGSTFWYSADGIEWTLSETALDYAPYNSICYGDGKFVAVGTDEEKGSLFAYSYNGIEWYKASLDNFPYAHWIVCYGKDKFVAISTSENIFAYSYNGLVWTAGTMNNGYIDKNSICYGNGKFVTLSYTSNEFVYSYNGIDWYFDVYADGGEHLCINSICHHNDLFIAVSDEGKCLYSYNGIDWYRSDITDEYTGWYSVCYGNGKFISVGHSINAVSRDASVLELEIRCFDIPDGKLVIPYYLGSHNNIVISGESSSVLKIVIPRGVDLVNNNKVMTNEDLVEMFKNLKSIIRIDEDGIMSKYKVGEIQNSGDINNLPNGDYI